MTLRGFWLGFRWTHCNGESSRTSALVAAYHRRDSITWRWTVMWFCPNGRFGMGRFQWRPGAGQAWFYVPLLGGLHVAWQPHLWLDALESRP